MSRSPKPLVPGRTPRPAAAGDGLLQKALRQLQAGNLHGAEKGARRFLAKNPNHPEGLHLSGMIAFQRGAYERSATLMARAVGAGSPSPDLLKNHGHVLKILGRLEEAAAAYRQALEQAPTDSAAWNDQGTVLNRMGCYPEAERSFRRAMELAPVDPKAFVNLAGLLTRLGRNPEAIDFSRAAIRVAPRLSAAYNALGNALRGRGDRSDLEEAAACYDRACHLDGTAPDPPVNLAALYEETARLEEARALCEAVLARIPGHPGASLVLARCLRRLGSIEAAQAILGEALTVDAPVDVVRDLATESSQINDRLGNTEAAFDAMRRANRLTMVSMGVDARLGDLFLERLDRLRQEGSHDMRAVRPDVRNVASDGLPDPIFLVGFPRSGTTLLGQILDSHTRLVMAEEQPFLDAVIGRLEADGECYAGKLGSLDSRTIRHLRAHYFDLFGKAIGCAWSGRADEPRPVDKFPLHLIHTGLVTVLFPHASLVFACRHPCDVVLSCFMQTFDPNPAMANFFSIERAASTYDKVMSLWQHDRERLNPSVHTVRYETLVEDNEAEVRRMLAALNLDWQDGLRDHAMRARTRGRIRTPSYHQVTEGIYTRARGRWRRYERQLAPVLPTLRPWIEKLGYAED